MSVKQRAHAWLVTACLAFLFAGQSAAESIDPVARGRYIAMTSGCNDCHTPGFMQREGDVPESEWLIGSSMGWRGPWGTTYATNLRVRARSMSAEDWLSYTRNLKTRPPMPFWSVNAMDEGDLLALRAYLRSLPPSDNVVPAYVEPGTEPGTPYMDLTVQGLPAGAD